MLDKTSNSNAVSALLSDAIIRESFLFPMERGLIPFGSRNATRPIPATSIVTA